MQTEALIRGLVFPSKPVMLCVFTVLRPVLLTALSLPGWWETMHHAAYILCLVSVIKRHGTRWCECVCTCVYVSPGLHFGSRLFQNWHNPNWVIHARLSLSPPQQERICVGLYMGNVCVCVCVEKIQYVLLKGWGWAKYYRFSTKHDSVLHMYSSPPGSCNLFSLCLFSITFFFISTLLSSLASRAARWKHSQVIEWCYFLQFLHKRTRGRDTGENKIILWN